MGFEVVGNHLKKYSGAEKHVVIPEGIIAIDDYAFYGAKMVETISIPNTVKELGNNVFYDCEALQEVIFPQSIDYIGAGVFVRCKNLKKVIFSDAIESLPKITFYQCESLEEVQLPNRLKRIQRAAFQQCHSLKEIDLPNQLKVLGENAFDDCVNLGKVNIQEGLETIEDNAFFQCQSLKQIIIPKSVKTIGKGAFETRGKVSIIAHTEIPMHSYMFDHNWNLNWNFGANGRYNGKNEENYQLYDSYLPNIDLKEWKPEAKCILCINYLETFKEENEIYDTWIKDNQKECIGKMIEDKRYRAFLQALDLQLLQMEEVEPFLNAIKEPQAKAQILARCHDVKKESDDILDLF